MPTLIETPAHRMNRRLSHREAEPLIEDGDILLFRGEWLVSKLFLAATRATISHSAFTLWWNRTLMVCEANEYFSWSGATKGVQARIFSQMIGRYRGTTHWFRLKDEYRAGLDMDRFVYEAQRNLGLPFGRAPMLRYLLHRFLGFRKPLDSPSPGSLFCGEYVARCYAAAGIRLCPDREAATTMPIDICNCGKLDYLGTIYYEE